MDHRVGVQPRLTRLRPGAVLWRDIDGEIVLLDIATSEYHLLNDTASAVWSVLVPAGVSEDDAVARVMDEFEIDELQARTDIRSFFAWCEARGWLER